MEDAQARAIDSLGQHGGSGSRRSADGELLIAGRRLDAAGRSTT